MKRLIVVLCVLAMTVSLVAGCTAENAGTTSSPQESVASSTTSTAPDASTETSVAPAEAYTVGFSNYSLGNSWRVQMQYELQAAADQYIADGVMDQLIITNSNGDIAKQISDVKDLITKKVDAILISAASADALAPVCEEAIAAGIVVVDFDNVVNSEKLTSTVAVDQLDFGRVGGQWLVDKLGGTGNIVVLNGMAGTSVSADRYAGAKEIFDKNPGIKIIAEANADWDYAKGKTAMEGFLSAYPEIDGVWTQGGAMTLAALDAFIAAGRPLVPMAGEAYNGLLKVWKDKHDEGFDTICPCMPTYISVSALDVAIKALNGESVDAEEMIELPVVEWDSIDQYLKADLPDSFWPITKMNDDQIATMYEENPIQ